MLFTPSKLLSRNTVAFCLVAVSDIASRRHLRSASRRHLLVSVPRHNLSTYGRRAFSVAGLAAWNSLCDELREPSLAADSFRQLLKTRLFAEYYSIQPIRGIAHYAIYKSYLLTYLVVVAVSAEQLVPRNLERLRHCRRFHAPYIKKLVRVTDVD